MTEMKSWKYVILLPVRWFQRLFCEEEEVNGKSEDRAFWGNDLTESPVSAMEREEKITSKSCVAFIKEHRTN